MEFYFLVYMVPYNLYIIENKQQDMDYSSWGFISQ